jgi:hypothetical protein
MKVVLTFDPVAVRHDWQRSKSTRDLSFGIYVIRDSVAYPDPTWNDFGLSVLGQWLMALINAWEGSCDAPEFWFLDGPFMLRGEMQADRKVISLTLERTAVVWTMSLLEFTEAIIVASNEACERLRELGVGEAALSPLESGVARLSGMARA